MIGMCWERIARVRNRVAAHDIKATESECHSCTEYGCYSESELWTSRGANGHGGYRRGAVDGFS